MSQRKSSPAANTIELTRHALRDLREIEEYSIRTWGRRVGDRYVDEIADALERLRENPDLLRSELDGLAGCGFYRMKRHFLVCHREGARIVVLTIMHTSMDLPSRLLELEPHLLAELELLSKKLPPAK